MIQSKKIPLYANSMTSQQPQGKVVVGLSTIPSRVGSLESVLMSLATQTHKPDAIYVSVPKHSTKENVDYPIKDMAKVIKKILPGVGKLIVVPEDYGPLTKLMGPLMQEDDAKTTIITVDDDQKYDPRLVETLIGGAKRHPESVVCMCGHVVGKFPCNWGFRCNRSDRWPVKLVYLEPDTRVDIVSGWCGVLYPRGVFGDKVPQPAMEDMRTRTLKILHRYDDLYVSAWLDMLGVHKYVTAYEGNSSDKTISDVANKNALSTGNSGPTAIAGIKHAKEFWGVIRALRSKGLLRSDIKVSWYKSINVMMTLAVVFTGVVIVGVVYFAVNDRRKGHSSSKKNNV